MLDVSGISDFVHLRALTGKQVQGVRNQVPGFNLEPETSLLEPRVFYHREHRGKSEEDPEIKKRFGVPAALLGVL
jgi:hypothetical protein